MRIGLLNPGPNAQFTLMPLGIGYIAAVIRQEKHDIVVVDADAEKLTFEQVANRLHDCKIIGVTINSSNYDIAIETINILKKSQPNCTIVAGGPYPSSFPVKLLKKNNSIDYAVFGEGEETFNELVMAIEQGLNIHSVLGIAYRDQKIIKNNPRPGIKDLDDLPFPARDLFPLEFYKTHPPYGVRQPYMNMITSRGCPYQCAYCSKSVFGYKLRMRSAKSVIAEIEHLIKHYGTREIHFYDDDFTLDMKRTEEICDLLLRKKISILWSCTTRVNLVNKVLLSKMKKAGCYIISYGVESGNQHILNTINKGITIEQIKNAFKMTKKAGILTVGFFMLGLPGETPRTIQQTINLAKEIRSDFSGWAITNVYKDTPMYNICKSRKGKFREPKTIQMYKSKGLKKDVLIFEEKMSNEELNVWLQRAYRAIYFNPHYILRRLTLIRSFNDLVGHIKGAISMLTIVLKK